MKPFYLTSPTLDTLMATNCDEQKMAKKLDPQDVAADKEQGKSTMPLNKERLIELRGFVPRD